MSAYSHQHDGEAMDMSHPSMANEDANLKSASSANKPSDAKHKHTACSFCASCCIGAVAPPYMPAAASVHTHSSAVLVSPSPLVTGFVPAGLERPPKRITT